MGVTVTLSTVIKVLNSHTILMGIGNELHLYAAPESKTPHIILPYTLPADIKGIRESNNYILVYGLKYFKILKYIKETLEFEEIYDDKISTCIMAATFLENAKEFILVAKESTVLRYRYIENEFHNIERVKIDNSILFCATTAGSNWNQLIIFSGNAQGELLIWQPKLQKTPKVALFQSELKHDGALRSIDYNEDFQLISTTCDNRSIKFWHVSNISENWLDAKITSYASGYGHTSRVYQSKMFMYQNEPFAVSTGEDSNFCIWHCDGRLLHRHSDQSGIIVNMDYYAKTHTLYTVTATGNLFDYNLLDILNDNANTPTIMPSSHIINAAEFITKVKFLTNTSTVIGITNYYNLVYYNINDNVKNCWHTIDKLFAPYKTAVLETFDNLIAFCGYKRVTILKFTQNNDEIKFELIYDDTQLKGMIRAFQFLSKDRYLISDESGMCLVMQSNQSDMDLYPLDLPLCKERWLTSALEIDNFLLVANRSGHLILYQNDLECQEYKMKFMLKKVHGHYGATVIKLYYQNDDKIFIQTTGHDGSICLLAIDCEYANMKIYTRERVPVAWIDAIITYRPFDILLGFNDKRLIAWSKQHNHMMSVPCGGGHRCWHYLLIDEDNIKYLQLVFIKHKEVLYYKMKLFKDKNVGIVMPPRNYWHTKSCNKMQLLELHKQRKILLASAGDDNLVKITTLDNIDNFDNRNFRQENEIHTHISNVRALKIFEMDENACFVVSGGGRAQLCITKLHFENYQIEEMLNHTLKTQNSDLKSTKPYEMNPETRIMSIDMMYDEKLENYIILLACSDGYLRKILFDMNFNILQQMSCFLGCCLLQVVIIEKLHLFLLTTTKGSVKFFTYELKEIYDLSLHANGCDAIDYYYDDDKYILHILTGGDDESITYNQIIIKDYQYNLSPSIINTLTFNHLHVSAVTAAHLWKDIVNNKLYSITSSVDKKLIIFDLQTMTTESVLNTCVFDTKGLCMTTDQLCLVYGFGIQSFNLKNK